MTKREKALIFILFLLISVFVFYKYVYEVNQSRIIQLSIKASKLDQEDLAIKQGAVIENKIFDEIKVLKGQIYNKSLYTMKNLDSENIIGVLEPIFSASNVFCKDISFSTPKLIDGSSSKEEISPNGLEIDKTISRLRQLKLNENKDEVKNTQENKVQLYSMMVAVNLLGDYDETIDFINQIVQHKIFIDIDKIEMSSINDIEGSSKITTNIFLTFYSVPRILDETKDAVEKNTNNERTNPFKTKNTQNENIRENNSKASDVSFEHLSISDLTISVKPSTSDLPTIMMGKTNDYSIESFVTSEIKTIENSKIYFKEIEGEYFCKYQIGGKTYPKDIKEWTSLGKDKNNIIIYIDSKKRNDVNDFSGLNLEIVNDTSIDVLVKIYGDDNENSRIRMTNQTDNVKILYY